MLGSQKSGQKDDRYVGMLETAWVGKWISWSFHSHLNIY